MSAIWQVYCPGVWEFTALKKMVMVLAFVKSVGGITPVEEAAWYNGQELRLRSRTSRIRKLWSAAYQLCNCEPVTPILSVGVPISVSYLLLHDKSPQNVGGLKQQMCLWARNSDVG